MPKESEAEIRAFIAADMPEDEKQAVSELQNSLKPTLPGARWTRPEGVHFTLKFLGNISPDTAQAVKSALGAAVRVKQFPVSFGRPGAFPSPVRARVLWIGIEDGAEPMRELAAAIEDSLVEIGFPREKRPFAAHLTLARFRNPCNINPDILNREVSIPGFTADSVTFYRSTLTPKGAVYTPLAEYQLGK